MKKGYIALISILIITAVTSLVAISAILMSINESNMGLTKNLSAEAYYLAEACAQEGLQQIADSIPFTGSGGLSLGNGTCSYVVASQGGQDRTVEASGTVNNIIRKTKITVDAITPNVNVTLWDEVADF